MAIALAALTALFFGVGDFCGGTASRRLPAPVVGVWAQLTGLAGLAVVVVLGSAGPSAVGLAWGVGSGALGGAGVLLLYAGLAAGPMAVVAPLTALMSAVVPVLVGVSLGDRPGPLTWTGIVLAVLASAVVGSSPGGATGAAPARRGVLYALVAGACFGGFFALLAQAPAADGLWPVAAARCGGALVALAALLATFAARRGSGRSERLEPSEPGGRVWPLVLAAGALDAGANVVYLLSVQRGQLAVIGAVVALYPAATVVLARLLHGERFSGVQRLGLGLAVTALVLVGATG